MDIINYYFENTILRVLVDFSEAESSSEENNVSVLQPIDIFDAQKASGIKFLTGL